MALKKTKTRKRRSFTDMIGIKTEAKPSEVEIAREEIEATCKDGYWFLRQMIDRAIVDFYQTGSYARLEEFVERPALDALKEKLNDLRSRKIAWVQPDRAKRKPRLDVVPAGLVLNKAGLPTRFVIEERFVDRSQHHHFVGGQVDRTSECPGRERTIRATVDVRNGQDYTLRSVVEVRPVA